MGEVNAALGWTTFADIKIWAGRWCCRWCRAKALRICDIEHQPWCRLLLTTVSERAEIGRQDG